MVQPSGSPPSQPYQPPQSVPYPVQPQGQPGPYYAPPLAPPRKKSSAAIVVAVIVVVVALIAVVVLVGSGSLLGGSPPAPPVTITGVNWNINYNGATSGYFGPSPQTQCSACPFTQRAGTQFTYTLSIQSSAIFLTHSIDSIVIAFPFTLVSSSPTLPISVSPGGTATITMTIQVPSQGGNYVMSATINTT